LPDIADLETPEQATRTNPAVPPHGHLQEEAARFQADGPCRALQEARKVRDATGLQDVEGPTAPTETDEAVGPPPGPGGKNVTDVEESVTAPETGLPVAPGRPAGQETMTFPAEEEAVQKPPAASPERKEDVSQRGKVRSV
jgi:hypothetical protein